MMLLSPSLSLTRKEKRGAPDLLGDLDGKSGGSKKSAAKRKSESATESVGGSSVLKMLGIIVDGYVDDALIAAVADAASLPECIAEAEELAITLQECDDIAASDEQLEATEVPGSVDATDLHADADAAPHAGISSFSSSSSSSVFGGFQPPIKDTIS